MCTISLMKIRIAAGLIFILISCDRKTNNEQTESTSQPDSTITASVDNPTQETEDCNSFSYKDFASPTGAFAKYLKKDGMIKIEWGNNQFKRVLKNTFDCNGRPNAIPWVDKVSTRHIIMRYSCGSPCWGIFALPLTQKDSVTEIMSDLDIDLVNDQIVYVDNKDYGSLTIENLNTHSKQNVKPKIDCKAAFLGFCIDSIHLANNKLYVAWIEWTNKRKTKVVDSVDVRL